jgi:hypothetical protein
MTTLFKIETTHPDAHGEITQSLKLLRLEDNLEIISTTGPVTIYEFQSDNPNDFISLGSVIACCQDFCELDGYKVQLDYLK